MKPSAEEKINNGIVAHRQHAAGPIGGFYGSKEAAQIPIYLGYAFRGLNTHGRALFTLAHRAMAGHDEDDYTITDGERICSTAIGWNFGDGHMHNEQLIAAMQQRCGFEPGEVRVVPARRAADPQSRPRSTDWSTRRRANSSAASQGRRHGDPPAVGRHPCPCRSTEMTTPTPPEPVAVWFDESGRLMSELGSVDNTCLARVRSGHCAGRHLCVVLDRAPGPRLLFGSELMSDLDDEAGIYLERACQTA